MRQIYVVSCLLSVVALTVVEMQPISVTGRVGQNLTIKCSDWNTLIDVTSNVKYFCYSPCTDDKHIIIKADFKKTKRNKSIELTNSPDGLFVTFFNLQKSDSKKYYCGVGRFGLDSYIEVNVKVEDAEFTTPKKTPQTSTVGPDVSAAVTDSFTVSLNNRSTSYSTLYTEASTASPSQGAGSVPYLLVGVTVIITVLLILLKLMRRMKKQPKAVSSAAMPHDDTQVGVEYDEIKWEHEQTQSHPSRFSDLYFPADSDCLYVNYQDAALIHRGHGYSEGVSLNPDSGFGVSSMGACSDSTVTDPQHESVYSVAQRPKEQAKATARFKRNQPESSENDCLYSLAQLPQTT